MDERAFKTLIDYLEKVPAIEKPINFHADERGFWSIQFRIDIRHKLAWNVVQEIGHVVNYISVKERLAAIFYPASSPPYINGGPEDCLFWVIETEDEKFRPGTLAKCLEGHLPRPVDDLTQWKI